MSNKKNIAALVGKAYACCPKKYRTKFLGLVLNLYRKELMKDLKTLKGELEIFEVPKRKKESIDGIVVAQQGLDALVLAYLLNRRLSEKDYNLVPILCDGILPICAPKELCTNKEVMIDDTKCNFICDYCKYQNFKILELLDLDYLVYSDFFDGGNKSLDINKADIDEIISDNVFYPIIDSTLKSHFRVGILPDKKEVNEIKERFATSAFLLKKVAEAVFKNYNIKDVFIYASAYVHGGVFGEVAKVNGINVIDVGSGFHESSQGSYLFFSKGNGACSPAHTPEELNKESEDLLYKIIKSRQQGSGPDVFYLKESEKDLAKSYTNSFPNKNGPIFGLFTNIIWDAAITTSNTIFNNIFEWIEFTIKWFTDHPNKNLIIKVHPEAPARQTKQNVYAWIIKNFELPDNVVVLPHDTKVNPYELYKEIDFGIVYTSTAGLEALLEQKPVIVCANTHYANRGFTADPKDISEYKKILEKNPGLSNEQYNLCKKYGYLFFVLRHFCIPLPRDTHRGLRIHPEKMLKALKGEDFQIERICNCIIKNEYFVNSDNSKIRELISKQIIEV